jgi:hypothetical protein
MSSGTTTNVIRLLGLWLLLNAHLGGGRATSYYAAPWADNDGDGGFERPWTLAMALSHPGVLQPGDVIWLRGGVYPGPFKSALAGSQDAPIVVRTYPGEHAILEGCSGPDSVLTVNGSWTWYWGFEVRSSHPDRTTDAFRGAGITVLGPHTKFINLVVHDNNQGFSFWTPAVDAELYGNLVYYNGWDAADRGHGHGVYAQNDIGVKQIADNLVFSQFSHGLHIYGTEEAPLDGFDIRGNALFQNGVLSKTTGYARNLLLGGGRVARRSTVVSNYTYYPTDQGAGENNLGYRAGCRDVAVQDNSLVGGTALAVINCESLSFSGNLVYGAMAVAVQARYPDNRYLATRPTAASTFVRPNRYEPGRAHIVVYNWPRADVVEADVSSAGLNRGDRYELRSSEDYFGKVVTGIYTGRPIQIPVTGWGVAQPVGFERPRTVLPEFGVFILTTLTEEPTCARVRRGDVCIEMPRPKN